MNPELENKLEELEKTRNEFWNVTSDTAKFLYLQALSKRARNMLELGTSNGYSTIWLGLAARELNAKVTTIEYWPERVQLAIENLSECNLKEFVTFIQGKVLLKLPEITDKFDYVFIDACKEEYIDYIKQLEKMLTDNAIIISDNITSHHEQLKDFLEYITEHPKFENVFIPMGEGLLLSYYRSSSFS